MTALVLLLGIAHAGWWSTFCERHLIADDPYQYEDASLEWLLRERDSYQIREHFRQLTPQQRSHLRIINAEIQRRGHE